MLPFGYVEGLLVHAMTHSRELLNRLSFGRPIPTYRMLESDIVKARESWTIPMHSVCLTASDNNQTKVSSWDAKRKETTVSQLNTLGKQV